VITIELSEHDFERLSDGAYPWAEGSWAAQPDLFENYTDRWAETENRPPRWDWAWAYDVGREWTAVIMARAYLQSIGEEFEIVWCMWDNPEPTYFILSNVVPRGF
jgi:hypothetical protein